jgi:hypothetical protein
MDAVVRSKAAEQADLVAAWQLLQAGYDRAMIEYRVQRHGWRVIHAGVYALTAAPLSRRQLWIAATLTSPSSFLSRASAGACFGFHQFEASFEIVTRPGTGGPRRVGDLLICRSQTLDGETTTHEGIAITTATRTLIDIAPGLNQSKMGRAFRESIRLKLTTAGDIAAAVARHQGRRGTRHLGELAARYATIPYQRTRSDPEGRALEEFHDADVEPPLVNVRIAGEEADLTWVRERRIIEIDGPQFHLFKDEDARKQAAWENAGYTVRRIPSGAVYADPRRLIALATGRQPA